MKTKIKCTWVKQWNFQRWAITTSIDFYSVWMIESSVVLALKDMRQRKKRNAVIVVA